MDTIDDAIRAMDDLLDRSMDTNDPRGYFTCVYRAVTVRVRDGIRAGEFDDNERMERFDVAFAQLYLDAARAFPARQPVSESWRITFEAPATRLLALQHVLAGMNAHINLDLGVAAARVQRGDDVAALRDDFERLNDVLAEMVDRMQAALLLSSPWGSFADRVAGRLDEAVSSWSIEYARSRAWSFAEQLASAGEHEARLIQEKDQRVAALGRRILRPGVPARWAVSLAGRRERAQVRAVAETLLSG